MGVETAAIVGGGMLLGAAGSYLGSREQAGAAREAAAQQAQLGREASALIGESYGGARQELMRGAQSQQRYLGQAGELIGQGASDVGALAGQLDARYAPQMQAGNAALGQLQAALLGGDTSGFTQSPGYQFRLAEGQKAIERAAAASGSYGSGSNLKDLMRYGQGVASQEYGNYLGQLMGLQQIGAQATAQSAQTALGAQGLRASLLGQQAGYLGQQGSVAGGLGNNLAALRTGVATNQANALTGAGSQAIQYQLAGSQATAQGYANIGNTLQQGAMLYGLAGGFGGGGGAPGQIGRTTLGTAPVTNTMNAPFAYGTLA